MIQSTFDYESWRNLENDEITAWRTAMAEAAAKKKKLPVLGPLLPPNWWPGTNDEWVSLSEETRWALSNQEDYAPEYTKEMMSKM